MPHTTALAEKRRGDGLAAITVRMDEPDAAGRLKTLLPTRGSASTPNLFSSAGGGSRAMEAFEIEGGALPFYKLYDRSGELRAEFGGDPWAEKQFGPKTWPQRSISCWRSSELLVAHRRAASRYR